MEELKFVGKPTPRIDQQEKVLGAARYVDDLDFGPNLLHAQVVESSLAHARIKKIDTSEAEKLPGVVKVVTGKDFPYHFGLYMQDRHIFAQDKVRFAGEQVAAVIARDLATAKRAAKRVKIIYEPLPAILDPREAVKKDATLIHPELGAYSHVPWFFPKPGSNIAHWRKVRKGDTIQGFAEADLIFADTYRVPRYAHCSIELHGAIGLCDHSGRITVWAASQSPHTQRHIFAQALAPLGFTHQNLRVITPYVGGGFGGKAGVTMEILAAALPTLVKGYPIKIHWTREQEFYNTYQRPALVGTLKMGVKKDGTITAFDYLIHWDAGAYVEYGANVVNASGLSATGPYRIPNVRIDALCVYTNLPPGGPYRGFGYPELLFGVESHTTRMAQQLGMDVVAFKRKNAIREGDKLPYGAPMTPNGLTECIDRVVKTIEWGKKEEHSDPNKAIGKGFAIFWKAPAMPPNAASSAFLKFNEDASVNLLISAVEIGQGVLTAMAQIAAEILTVPPEKIRVESPDTDRNPYEWQTVASHVAWGTGNAVKRAAIDAREQIFEAVHHACFLEKDALYLEDEAVKCRTQPGFALLLKEIVINGIMVEDGTYRGGPIMGRGTFMPRFTSAMGDPDTGQGGHPCVHYTVGAAALTLEVDKQTGRMKVLKAVEAIDAGKAINPQIVKDQICGGLLQGLGTVLYEDMRFDESGKLLNPNFTDYKLPTAMDIPDEVIPIIVETPQADGPFGARGIAEHPTIPAAPMVANAVCDAVGVRVKSMPVTAEKVGLALAAGQTEVE